MSELSINTNPSSFVALETLNDTSTDLSHTENAISTGKKVATAGDNPAAFGIDQEIGGEVAGQNAVNDGLSYAASLINTSTSAANSIIDILKNIRGTITAAGDVVGEKGAEEDFDHQITGYLNEINTIARSATSNGVNILVGTASDGFDITSTSLSYVTSLEGNTSQVDSAVRMLGSAHLVDMNLATGSRDHIHFESPTGGFPFVDPATANTMAAALGLTLCDQPNGSVTTNIFSLDLEGKGAGPGVIRGIPGDPLKFSNHMNLFIDYVDNAIKGMQYVTAKLGVNSRTIQSLVSFGTRLGDNLQDSQSALVDADMSKESAQMASLQTKEQLGIKSLTIANGQSQNVLALFQG